MSYGTWILIRRVISTALCCILWLMPRRYVLTVFYCFLLLWWNDELCLFFLFIGEYKSCIRGCFWCLDFFFNGTFDLVEFDRPFSGLQSHKAIRTFKIMRSCGLPANIAIYNIMIECCKLLPCIKSASTLLSLMFRDGFCPTVLTFTSLLKVSLVKCRAVTTHYTFFLN